MNTLSRAERLSGKKTIGNLFAHGKRFSFSPFRVIWLERKDDLSINLRFGIAVSKKISKLAVQRNRIKRISREAFRINKHEAIRELEQQGKKLDFFLIYSGTVQTDSSEIREKIILILKRLSRIHAKTSE
jgi:ribonuclease P protein component